MRWLLNVLKAMGLFLALFVGVALLLPARQHVERHRDIMVGAERLWPLIADPKRWTAWSPWYAKDPTMRLRYSGAASGTGAEWSWHSRSQGEGRMRFEAAEPPRRLDYALTFVEMGTAARGAFRLDPIEGGTRVTWSFDAELGLNPMLRWIGLGFDRLIGTDLEAGLGRLAVIAGM